jgi:hypothetical protein
MSFKTMSLAAAGLMCATLALPSPALAAAPLTPAQQFKLHCGMVFATIAAVQEQKDPRGKAYPPMAERGREYFMRAVNGVMQSTGMTQDEVKALLWAQAQELARQGELEKAAPLCLKSLEDSGL